MGWDPFFWAEFSRYIQTNNDFWSLASSVFHSEQHRAYPPGLALFASIFMGLFPYQEYSQYLAFVTPLIFLILTAIKLCRDYLGPETAATFLLAALCFGLVKTLGIANPVNFLSADIAIAAFFAACLLVALFEKKTTLATIFLAVALPAFSLLKSTCVLFSLSVVLIFFVRTYTHGRKEIILSAFRAAILCILSVLPLLVWDHALAARSIASTASHLNMAQVLSFVDQMDPAKAATLRNMAEYFFSGPVIAIYPAFLHPLTSTFALVVYSVILFTLGYRKEKGRQMAYLFCLLATFAGWLLTYALVITLVLPDALADYIVTFTYPRYVGPFICPIFIVAIFIYVLPQGQAAIRSKSKRINIASAIVIAVLPFYAIGIYQRAHPPIRHHGMPLSLFQEESETAWDMIDTAQKFIIQNTPVNSRIWTLLDASDTSRKFVQMGFYLRPYRDNHVTLSVKPGLPDVETRRALIKDGVTHIFLLSPQRLPLREFGGFIALPQTDCPVLADIRPWKENARAEAGAVVFEDAWWCENKSPDAEPPLAKNSVKRP